jgi:glutamyl-tRNA(Gln) amidotransferase subunit E
MYPETDVRPVKITDSWIKRIKKAMPETLTEKERRFVKELGLSTDLAGQMTNSLNLDLFEYVLSQLEISPTLVAVTLENTLVSMQRDGIPIEHIKDDQLLDVFETVTKSEMSSEALPEILAYLANNPSAAIQEALSKTGLGKIETEDIEKIIRRIVEARLDFVREKGEAAVGGLMGVAMKELRGKADGKLVKDLLASEVKRVLAQ